MDIHSTKSGKVVIEIIFSTLILIIIGLVFVRQVPHATILDYIKIFISWPGAIIIVAIISFYLFRFELKGGQKTKILYEKDPNVTGFINIKEKKENGDFVIGIKRNYKICDGDAVVNKAFVMRFYDMQKELESLKLELKIYQEKLLEM